MTDLITLKWRLEKDIPFTNSIDILYMYFGDGYEFGEEWRFKNIKTLIDYVLFLTDIPKPKKSIKKIRDKLLSAYDKIIKDNDYKLVEKYLNLYLSNRCDKYVISEDKIDII